MDQLSTNRFKLELIQDFHYEHLKQYISEKQLWVYSTIKMESDNDFKKYFNQALRMTKQTSQRAYVILDLQQNKYVGMTRLYAFDSANKSTKIGFTWYNLATQGSGINTHCKYLILKCAFEDLGIERVELNADLRNKRSIAAMHKIGFIQEGILRKHIYVPDGFKRDTIVFSLLKDEWQNHVKSKLEKLISE